MECFCWPYCVLHIFGQVPLLLWWDRVYNMEWRQWHRIVYRYHWLWWLMAWLYALFPMCLPACTFSTLNSKSILWVHIQGVVAEHFWYICLLGRMIAGLSYGRFVAICCKFKLPTYIQEPMVIDRRNYLQRDLNRERFSSR